MFNAFAIVSRHSIHPSNSVRRGSEISLRKANAFVKTREMRWTLYACTRWPSAFEPARIIALGRALCRWSRRCGMTRGRSSVGTQIIKPTPHAISVRSMILIAVPHHARQHCIRWSSCVISLCVRSRNLVGAATAGVSALRCGGQRMDRGRRPRWCRQITVPQEAAYQACAADLSSSVAQSCAPASTAVQHPVIQQDIRPRWNPSGSFRGWSVQ